MKNIRNADLLVVLHDFTKFILQMKPKAKEMNADEIELYDKLEHLNDNIDIVLSNCDDVPNVLCHHWLTSWDIEQDLDFMCDNVELTKEERQDIEDELNDIYDYDLQHWDGWQKCLFDVYTELFPERV